MGLKSWWNNLWDKIGNFIKKAWKLAKPFLQEILSETAALAFEALKDLAIEAVKYVATQGLPDDESKKKAFAEYMKKTSQDKVAELKDSELNLLRETALAIYKKAQEQ